ncbi:uncharacterized protein LOC110855893 isoform X2 [Folsomia candida]|uniref:uncharacterized protein LOC110855893 isoform X2 n=1 Tax=Folsomia candida TaxID=158441 RepID=UPI000B905552|nr:uncharacterized protein LOC110855893 isoform X2 [Folsomia candida]
MSNPLRRLTPEERSEEYERNPNQPDNIGGAVGGMRLRDENALSFRHFLQPHSDVVPQPAPTRCRGTRGGVDLVEATMALPDFVQDHLVLESLAAAAEPSQDMSPSRPHADHPLDLHVLNDILPDFGGSSSQRNPRGRNSHNSSRRSGHDPLANNLDISIGSALPDFLSDGPMQLNHDPNTVNSPSPSSGNRGSRNRQAVENSLPDVEPVRGPSFDSKESLRLQIDRLRSEVTEKNRRINLLETELASQRSTSTNLELSLRTTERNLVDAVKRATEAEQLANPTCQHDINYVNGHGDIFPTSSSENGLRMNSAAIHSIARTSEGLIGQLLHHMQELKKITEDEPPSQEKTKNSDKEVKPRSSR